MGGAKSAPMENETRFERWLDRALGRAATPRRGAEVIAAVTTVMAVGSGLLMTVIDHKNFSNIWLGLWWSVQTVTTVGYGDHVPTNAAGMLVAAFVMLLGLAFLSVVTAAITSSFVARATEQRRAAKQRTRGAGDGAPAAEHDVSGIHERLDRMEDDVVERLDRVEALLLKRS